MKGVIVMNQATKQFVFGSLVGILLGIPFSRTLAELFGTGWWTLLVTIPVFGTFGYIFYDIDSVIRALKHSFKEVVEWRPNKEWWSLFGRNIKYSLIFSTSFSTSIFLVCFFALTIMLPFLFFPGFNLLVSNLMRVPVLVIFVSFPLLALFFLCVDIINFSGADATYVSNIEQVAQKYNGITVLRFAISAICYIAPRSYWFIWGPILFACQTLLVTCKVLVKTYRYIHSDERKAVFVTVALGITIGFSVDVFLGNLILATLTGALIGIPFGLFLHRVVAIRLVGIEPLQMS